MSMPVHYCLGLGPKEYARKADPWNSKLVARAIGKLTRAAAFERLDLLPSFAWHKADTLASHLMAQLSFESHDDARALHRALKSAQPLNEEDYGFDPDPEITAQDVWSPIGPGGGIFGDRNRAEQLTNIAGLGDATGNGVNVIIVDRGLKSETVDAIAVRMANRRGLAPRLPAPVLGWTRYEPISNKRGERVWHRIRPGATGSDHADMIVRNILAVAPEATIWDAPLLPSENQPDAPPRLSIAANLFHWIKQAVTSGQVRSWDSSKRREVTVPFSRPCVVVNAWAIMDPHTDPDPAARNYADDPDHHLTNDVTRLDGEEIDVVFAAGNCGEPCPDQRCGPGDTGPSRSIFGLNGHPDVLTVGAVRADGLPIALSAQGPGRLATKGSRGKLDYSRSKTMRAYEKPDLCAPSHFRESDDASEYNTGTSAACGFAAGVLAALRSHAAGRFISPECMRSVLRKTARRAKGDEWDRRLGYGVIDAAAALDRLCESMTEGTSGVAGRR
jgi:hypothetical protein